MSPKFLHLLLRKTGFRRAQRLWRTAFNAIETQMVHGVAIRIPRIHGMRCAESEPWMTNVLEQLLPKCPGVFLDVGVNLGQTLVKLKAIEPGREVVGFEPNPVCVFYVQELVRLNAFCSCHLLPVGLHQRDSVLTLELYVEDPSDASASLVQGFRPDHEIHARVQVPVFRYDSLEGPWKERPVGIVKIDVEGAELDVMHSLAGMIRRDRPILLMEVLPVYSTDHRERKSRQDQLEHLLTDLHYSMLRIRKGPGDTLAGVDPIATIGIHSDLAACEYLMVPFDRLATVRSWFP